MNTLKSKFISALSSLVLLISISTNVSAADLNLGGFSGILNTTLSSGFSMRTEQNDCRLISGDSLNPTGSALEDRSSFTTFVGYAPDDGNGGCNVYETDSYGNTSSKTLARVNSNQDDGKLNFGRGDVFDAGNTLSLSYLGTNSAGASLNLSATAYYNAALEINAPSFKAFTSDQSDYFENQYKIGNAYISTPLNDNVSITIGNYIQSQGVTALLPIGVNVVNPVNLPLLRSPGAQLKDALLPQAMVGVNAYLDGGITLDAYYQLEQKEVEIDAAGSFYGSDFVGVNSSTDLMNSPNYRENKNIPLGGNYHDAATCFAAGGTAGGCTDASLYAGIETDGSGTHTRSGEYYGHYNQFLLGAGGTAGLVSAFNTANDETAEGAVADATDLDSLITNSLQSASSILTLSGPGAQNVGVTLTDAQINGSLTRLWTQYEGVGVSSGLVSVSRAADIKADDSGQFGVNLSGYIDDIGLGVEWGLYFNNSHANAPRVRFLTIADGYASTLYSAYTIQNEGVDYTDGISAFEQYQSSIAYGSLICGVVYKALTKSAAPYGTFSSESTSTASYLHDPGKCYATIDTLGAGGGSLAWAAQQAAGTNTYASEAAAQTAITAAAHGQGIAASNGALATLGFGNAARYQLYYPEDIQTIGASLSTGVGSWSTNLEVAFRPDFPFQVSVPQLLLNVYDSTGGTMIQNLISYGASDDTSKGVIGLANAVSLNKWSSQPNCDISSATGEMSTVMSGYAVCDGTAEFDAWSLDFNAVRTFSASDPIALGAGADSGFLLVEIGGVYIPSINSAQGLVSTNHQSFGHDNYGGGCLDSAGLSKLAVQNNALFGDGYCENNSEADNLAMTSRIRTGLSYFNFNNSAWTFAPSLGLDYDFLGNGASSLGGYTEDKMKLTLGSSFSNGGTSISFNYVNELGGFEDNSSSDRDYVSASVSHAF
ncbi:DUF1302 domain-containing protein [Pelagibacterales bacterium]|nr:DUF1302 domain-containing protein [Pelagibacterales bacterium]